MPSCLVSMSVLLHCLCFYFSLLGRGCQCHIEETIGNFVIFKSGNVFLFNVSRLNTSMKETKMLYTLWYTLNFYLTTFCYILFKCFCRTKLNKTLPNQRNTTKLLCCIDLLRRTIDLLKQLHLLYVEFCNLILRLSTIWSNLLFLPDSKYLLFLTWKLHDREL